MVLRRQEDLRRRVGVGRSLAGVPTRSPASAGRQRPPQLGSGRAHPAHGRLRDPSPGALSEHRRVPGQRVHRDGGRPGPGSGLCARLQRLPRRVVRDRAGAVRAAHDGPVLGPGRDDDRDGPGPRRRAPGHRLPGPDGGLRPSPTVRRPLGPVLGGGAGDGAVDQLPHRLGQHSDVRHGEHRAAPELRLDRVAAFPPERLGDRVPALRRHLPTVPSPELRVGRERGGMDPVPAREPRLAVPQHRLCSGASRARAAAQRVLRSPDLQLLLVRGGDRPGPRSSCSARTRSCSKPISHTRPG